MTTPEPVEIRVCSICGQSWDKHLRRAGERVRSMMYDSDIHEMSTQERVEEMNKRSISVVNDCVPLLKEANMGPEGPPGPMGPMGNNPPPCPHT